MAIRRLKRILEPEKEGIIEALKAFLQSREEIVFALLYGSLVNPEFPGKYGDIDIALYVRSEQLVAPNYVFESKIEAEAYHLLSSRGLGLLPVEVSLINHAPYPFIVKLFKGGYIILKEDEDVLTDFIDEIGRESMDNSHLRSESLRELLEV